MIHEGDEAKSRTNFVKHGLDFSDAEEVLTGQMARNGSSPWDCSPVEVVIIAHTPRGENVTRIISMRKANRREQKIYQKRLGES